jgi:hypothetical protein
MVMRAAFLMPLAAMPEERYFEGLEIWVLGDGHGSLSTETILTTVDNEGV